MTFDLRLHTTLPAIVHALSLIHDAAEANRAVPVTPQAARRLTRPNLAKATRGTLGIEGIEISEDDALNLMARLDASFLGPSWQQAEREARNAANLMSQVADILRQDPGTPVSEPLVLTFHRTLTQGIDYPNNQSGRYRNHAVVVGSDRQPADGDTARRLMTEFVRWMNGGPPNRWAPSSPPYVPTSTWCPSTPSATATAASHAPSRIWPSPAATAPTTASTACQPRSCAAATTTTKPCRSPSRVQWTSPIGWSGFSND